MTRDLPAPWTAERSLTRDCWYVAAADGQVVATNLTKRDARLIAQVHDLSAALAETSDIIDRVLAVRP